jgi:hypothetical protein
MGRNGGHQRGVSMAAYGEVFMATDTRRRTRLLSATTSGVDMVAATAARSAVSDERAQFVPAKDSSASTPSPMPLLLCP